MEPDYWVVKLGGAMHSKAGSDRDFGSLTAGIQQLCDFRLTALARGRTVSWGGVNVWTPLQRWGGKGQG